MSSRKSSARDCGVEDVAGAMFSVKLTGMLRVQGGLVLHRIFVAQMAISYSFSVY
jgi:hypothetical protein